MRFAADARRWRNLAANCLVWAIATDLRGSLSSAISHPQYLIPYASYALISPPTFNFQLLTFNYLMTKLKLILELLNSCLQAIWNTLFKS